MKGRRAECYNQCSSDVFFTKNGNFIKYCKKFDKSKMTHIHRFFIFTVSATAVHSGKQAPVPS
jgi:hypothetical protein